LDFVFFKVYNIFFILLLTLAVHPWVGFDLLKIFVTVMFFCEMGSSAPRPTSNLEDQGIPFSLGHHL
jgi:hypothetical protein